MPGFVSRLCSRRAIGATIFIDVGLRRRRLESVQRGERERGARRRQRGGRIGRGSPRGRPPRDDCLPVIGRGRAHLDTMGHTSAQVAEHECVNIFRVQETRRIIK